MRNGDVQCILKLSRDRYMTLWQGNYHNTETCHLTRFFSLYMTVYVSVALRNLIAADPVFSIAEGQTRFWCLGVVFNHLMGILSYIIAI